MERRRTFWTIIFGAVLSACTLATGQEPPAPPPTSLPMVPVSSPAGTLPDTPFPMLDTFTGPYANVVALLDGVCFEFLSTLNGETWVWTSLSELASFYDRVDASALCPAPVRRGTFDFVQQVLAGAVNTAVGCDAAHRFVNLAQDDAARTQAVIFTFAVQPGCDYELAQPLLIAVPRPPDGYTLRVVVTAL